MAVAIVVSAASVAFAADDVASTAQSLVERAGVQRGVCSVVTLDAGDLLPIAIAQSSGLFVHVRTDSAPVVEELRAAAKAANLGIDRFVVEHGSTQPAPIR